MPCEADEYVHDFIVVVRQERDGRALFAGTTRTTCKRGQDLLEHCANRGIDYR